MVPQVTRCFSDKVSEKTLELTIGCHSHSPFLSIIFEKITNYKNINFIVSPTKVTRGPLSNRSHYFNGWLASNSPGGDS